MEEFKKLGLSEKVIKALEKKGFEKPTPIQELTIPLLLKGNKDVVGKAQTGTGKTACFALPIIERISKSKDVQAIILTPTRELALQVSKEIESLQGDKKFSILAVYGGSSIRDQMDKLRKGVQIVVGTPGRVMDLMNRKRLNLYHVAYAVLDEADEMLNMGFVDDIEEILSQTNKDKKMLLFSATMPREILKIAKKFMKDYELIEVENTQITSDLTKQVYYEVTGRDRMEALHRIIDITPDFHGIIFCKTRLMVDEVANKLINSNYDAAALHGDISQAQREKILGLFRKKSVSILVATDVAARGIDVNNLTHVINFSLPQSPEYYVHRIGRTGRAGKKGIAITFLIPSERRKLKFIERVVKQSLIKGTLPPIKEVLEIKKKAIKERLDKILKDDNTKKYEDISKALLAENSPEKVVSALLKYIFKSEVESSKYKELQKVKPDNDRSRGRERRSSRGRSRDRPRNKRSSHREQSDRPRGRSSHGRTRNKKTSHREQRDRPERNYDKPRSHKAKPRESGRNTKHEKFTPRTKKSHNSSKVKRMRNHRAKNKKSRSFR